MTRLIWCIEHQDFHPLQEEWTPIAWKAYRLAQAIIANQHGAWRYN